MDVCAVAWVTVLRSWRGVDGRAAAVLCACAAMCLLCFGFVFQRGGRSQSADVFATRHNCLLCLGGCEHSNRGDESALLCLPVCQRMVLAGVKEGKLGLWSCQVCCRMCGLREFFKPYPAAGGLADFIGCVFTAWHLVALPKATKE
jgi:hypothetical protein